MTTSKNFKTDFLLKSRGSFLLGLGSVLNLQGNYYQYNTSNSSREADYKAIASDWGVIGQDIEIGITKFREELNAHNFTQLSLDFD